MQANPSSYPAPSCMYERSTTSRDTSITGIINAYVCNVARDVRKSARIKSTRTGAFRSFPTGALWYHHGASRTLLSGSNIVSEFQFYFIFKLLSHMYILLIKKLLRISLCFLWCIPFPNTIPLYKLYKLHKSWKIVREKGSKSIKAIAILGSRERFATNEEIRAIYARQPDKTILTHAQPPAVCRTNNRLRRKGLS